MLARPRQHSTGIRRLRDRRNAADGEAADFAAMVAVQSGAWEHLQIRPAPRGSDTAAVPAMRVGLWIE